MAWFPISVFSLEFHSEQKMICGFVSILARDLGCFCGGGGCHCAGGGGGDGGGDGDVY